MRSISNFDPREFARLFSASSTHYATASWGPARGGEPGQIGHDTLWLALSRSARAITRLVSRGSTTDSEPLRRVSILPRGMTLGVTQQIPTEDRHVLTQPQLAARLQVLMGGYSAERLVFENVSTGAEGDLKAATGLATKMVAQYGMSAYLGAVYYDHDESHPFLGRKMAVAGGSSDATIHAIESEARKLLATALEEATTLLTKHRSKLDALQARLVDIETVEEGMLRQLLGADTAAIHGTG